MWRVELVGPVGAIRPVEPVVPWAHGPKNRSRKLPMWGNHFLRSEQIDVQHHDNQNEPKIPAGESLHKQSSAVEGIVLEFEDRITNQEMGTHEQLRQASLLPESRRPNHKALTGYPARLARGGSEVEGSSLSLSLI